MHCNIWEWDWQGESELSLWFANSKIVLQGKENKNLVIQFLFKE